MEPGNQACAIHTYVSQNYNSRLVGPRTIHQALGMGSNEKETKLLQCYFSRTWQYDCTRLDIVYIFSCPTLTSSDGCCISPPFSSLPCQLFGLALTFFVSTPDFSCSLYGRICSVDWTLVVPPFEQLGASVPHAACGGR